MEIKWKRLDPLEARIFNREMDQRTTILRDAFLAHGIDPSFHGHPMTVLAVLLDEKQKDRFIETILCDKETWNAFLTEIADWEYVRSSKKLIGGYEVWFMWDDDGRVLPKRAKLN